MNTIDKLKKFLAKLPGIGPRQALRLILAISELPESEVKDFTKDLEGFRTKIKFCSLCHNFIAEDASDQKLCSICSNSQRDQKLIMVVEKISDLESIERTKKYTGLYHILGGAIDPPNGSHPQNLKVNNLLTRIKKNSVDEIILATNPTSTGDLTALFIEQEIKKTGLSVSITRLARGISMGSLIEYIDEVTLEEALNNRKTKITSQKT